MMSLATTLVQSWTLMTMMTIWMQMTETQTRSFFVLKGGKRNCACAQALF